jgi:hypothetical protein
VTGSKIRAVGAAIQKHRLWDQFIVQDRILGMQTLIFIAAEEERAPLIHATRALTTVEVRIFEASAKVQRLKAWDSLVHAAHLLPSDIVVASLGSLPGGPWNWVKQLARLAALDARLVSLSEPAITLEAGQRDLLRVLERARECEIRERMRSAIEKARASGRKIGRPRTQVPVHLVLEARQTLSLRETARKFGISATSVSRICTHARELGGDVAGGEK